MCRLLYVKSKQDVDMSIHLNALADISKHSKEDQGDGWGVAYWQYYIKNVYKSTKPIWEDGLNFGTSRRFVAHARSAFDEDVNIDKNMPFFDDEYVFIFNGELNGVRRLSQEGATGAEKIFNLVKEKAVEKGDLKSALKAALRVIESRTSYVRACNIIIADKSNAYACCLFNEDPDYFSLHYTEGGLSIVSSEPYECGLEWKVMNSGDIISPT